MSSNKRSVQVGDFAIGSGEPLCLMSGPCVIESEEHALRCAEALAQIMQGRNINLIYKSSYDKANRSSIHSYRGLGIEEGLAILQRVRNETGLPVITDIHTPEEARMAGEVCDVLQIPAFLCRQTDLLVAAGRTGRVVHIKKGQFVAPWDMGHPAEKITSTGNQRVILSDRGSCFGYNQLVSDFRSIPIMQQLGYPVSYDASHSVQKPGGLGHATDGDREFIPALSRAAVAAGADCLYLESHPNPAAALSDATTVFPLDQLPTLLSLLERLREVVMDEALLCPLEMR
jgi:2-dehydro-3-deoxyphosphooctonate aldolase (KDO 8-P synthase)